MVDHDEDDAVQAGPPIEPRLLTIPEAAKVLRVGRTTVYELIDGGQLVSVRVGRRHLVPVVELDRFVAALIAAARPDDAS